MEDRLDRAYSRHQKGPTMKNEFCDECSFLSPNEQEQKKGEAHMCLKLQKRLLHKAQHPHIPRPKDCPLRKAEERRK
jgi:hypothetical protein